MPAPAPVFVPLTDEDRGTPGASARAEGVRRSEKRERAIREAHPRLAWLKLAFSDDPRSTKVWAQGAVGEERIGAHLEAARGRGIEVLHDRRIPRSRANIDHLVVGRPAVWVVDPKRYLNARVGVRDVGSRRAPDRRLFVGGRDRSKLVDGMRRQVELVEGIVAEFSPGPVPVRGALCFVDADIGRFAKPFTVDGVLVTWRKHLLAPLLDEDGLGAIDDDRRDHLARYLADRLPVA